MAIDCWPLAETMAIDVAFRAGGLMLFFILLFLSTRRRIPRGLELPPGPPGKLIIGNLADIPAQHEWETYTKWAQEYGDLFHIKVFGQSMVFVNSMDIAQELFERRSSLYSDRVHFVMLCDLVGFNWAIPAMKYGERWRQHRRMFHQYFHPQASLAYLDIQTKHTMEILRNFRKSPTDFIEHIRHFASAIPIDVAYGIEVLPTGDPYIETAKKGMASAAKAGNPGSFLVESLSILKYVPAWMPGASFQRKARIWRKLVTDMVEMPFRAVKHALEIGTARPSVTASLLDKFSNQEGVSGDREEMIKNVAAIVYAAGSDTVTSALSCFMLAMVLYPEAQRKAQEELDRIIGTNRLPTFEDRSSLPYINALCNEVLRWRPALPLGVGHRIRQDDVYGRYFIPEGSFVIGNAWALLHDEKTYGPYPEEFRPERFLNTGVLYRTVAFGFGRRICPGRTLADNSLFIAVSSILHIFDISHARDNNGNVILVRDSLTSGMTVYPEPFQCSITLRSGSAEGLILDKVAFPFSL